MSDAATTEKHPCSGCGYMMRGGSMCGDCREYGPPRDWRWEYDPATGKHKRVPDAATTAPPFLMTKAGTFTAKAVEELVARIEGLEGDLALVKREKSILMRELSRFTNAA